MVTIDDTQSGFWFELEDDSCINEQYHYGYYITGTVEFIKGGAVETNITGLYIHTGVTRFHWEGYFKAGRKYNIALHCATIQGHTKGLEKIFNTELGEYMLNTILFFDRELLVIYQ